MVDSAPHSRLTLSSAGLDGIGGAALAFGLVTLAFADVGGDGGAGLRLIGLLALGALLGRLAAAFPGSAGGARRARLLLMMAITIVCLNEGYGHAPRWALAAVAYLVRGLVRSPATRS